MKQHFDFVIVDNTEILLDGVVCKVVYPLYTNAIRKLTLERLDLTVRAYNTLKRGGITTLDDLLTCSLGDLLKIKNIGRKSAVEVVEKLSMMMFHIQAK